jgi:uncharacterized protein (TIGR03067 family)
VFADYGDGVLQVSEDGHLALLWLGTNSVFLFTDGTNTMRGSRYERKVDKIDAERETLAELQGEWLRVSGIFSRKPATPMSLVLKGNDATTIVVGKPELKETITIDPTKSPKTIDFEMTDGSGSTITRLGIFSVEGGQLMLNVAVPGGNRPRNFVHGGTISEWKRQEPVAP